MHIIRYADSVFSLPKKILKICVVPKDATTRPRVDLEFVPRYSDSVFLVLIEYTQKGSLLANGDMPRGYSNTRLCGQIAATCKRETADKIYEALALSVFTSRGSGVCVCLDVRDIMAADVVQQPAPRQGKGRAVDIDGTGITAIAQQLTKAPEVHVTRYGGGTDWGRSPSQSAGGWLGAYGSCGGGGGGAVSIPSVASIAGWSLSSNAPRTELDARDGRDERTASMWAAPGTSAAVVTALSNQEAQRVSSNVTQDGDTTYAVTEGTEVTQQDVADTIAAINAERRRRNTGVESLGRPLTRTELQGMLDDIDGLTHE